MHQPPERRPVDVVAGEQPLQVGRHAERRRGPQRRDRRGRAGGVEGPGQQHLAAREQRVDREPQRRAVVQRREDQVPVARPEAPEVDLLGGQRPGVVLGQDAGPDALAPARRPGRVVHRPGQRHVGEVGLRRRPAAAPGRRPTSSAGSASSASAARSAAGSPGSRTTGTMPVRRAPSTTASSAGDAAAETSSRSPARSPAAASAAAARRWSRSLSAASPPGRSRHARRTASSARCRPRPGPRRAAWPGWPGWTAPRPATAARGTSA